MISRPKKRRRQIRKENNKRKNEALAKMLVAPLAKRVGYVELAKAIFVVEPLEAPSEGTPQES